MREEERGGGAGVEEEEIARCERERGAEVGAERSKIPPFSWRVIRLAARVARM